MVTMPVSFDREKCESKKLYKYPCHFDDGKPFFGVKSEYLLTRLFSNGMHIPIVRERQEQIEL